MEKEGPRILLVDDEQSMRDILNVTLRPAGYSVYAASSGGDGLKCMTGP